MRAHFNEDDLSKSLKVIEHRTTCMFSFEFGKGGLARMEELNTKVDVDTTSDKTRKKESRKRQR